MIQYKTTAILSITVVLMAGAANVGASHGGQHDEASGTLEGPEGLCTVKANVWWQGTGATPRPMGYHFAMYDSSGVFCPAQGSLLRLLTGTIDTCEIPDDDVLDLYDCSTLGSSVPGCKWAKAKTTVGTTGEQMETGWLASPNC